ncbi:iron reductase [[Pantoea] beijingensis]|uniref:Iron reductase n=1 Tax=[Pantoea] beijingensis TaxID=1324864 RepID=A0A443I9P2_9GAMM|nr:MULTISPECIES: siderophore-iron reductase FhuF [Erwiniaceae]RWR00921.1 iron reductase [[Pantoea] beijingensis]
MAIITRQVHEYGAYPLIFLHSDRSLGAALHTLFRQHRAYFLDAIKLGEEAPARCMTLDYWSRRKTFLQLSTRYADDIYRQHQNLPREAKPLHSLWAQWYFGLVVPPMMMALLFETRSIDCSPQHFHVEFHDSGRPAIFWLNVREDKGARYLNAHQRIDRMIQRHLIPVTQAIEQQGEINARLIWNNIGYLMHWFLGELEPLLAEDTRIMLEHALFFSRERPDGCDNPLYRSVIPRGGDMQRRCCCQRYRLPGIQRCGDCTLKPV